MQEIEEPRLDRRQLLVRSGGLLALTAAGPLLAACGSDGAGSSATATQAIRAPGGAFDQFSYQGYLIPDVREVRAWQRQHGIKARPTFIASETEVAAKIVGSGGNSGIDAITYYQGYTQRYDALDLLLPIDEERVPNLRNLFSFFAGDTGNFWVNADGQRTGVPYLWGFAGLTYNEAEVRPTSYYDLLESEFTGKVALIDDPQITFVLASHVLGMDPSRVAKDDYGRVKDFLSQMVGQSKGASPTFADLATRIISGDATAIFTGFASIDLSAAAKGKTSVTTVLPREGGVGFCDAWAIPRTCDNLGTAYSWLNLVLEPAVDAGAAMANYYSVTVEDAVPLLSRDIRSLVDYSDIDNVLTQAPFYDNPPQQSSEFVTFDEMVEGWQEIKTQA
jgi:spermidine/putrescine transport system substrate-binding protein